MELQTLLFSQVIKVHEAFENSLIMAATIVTVRVTVRTGEHWWVTVTVLVTVLMVKTGECYAVRDGKNRWNG